MFPKLLKLSILFILLLASYNTASASFTVSRPPTLNAGLVGYWTFDGADTNFTTNTVTDKSGQGNTGTMTNMSTTTARAPGKIGQALKFDGVDDYITIADQDYFGPSVNSLTVSLWAKISKDASPRGDNTYSSTGRTMISKGNPWEWYIENDNNIYFCNTINDPLNGSNNGFCSSSRTMNDGQWHLYTFTLVNNVLLEGYIDGVKIVSDSSFGVPVTNNGSAPVTIGRNGLGNYFNGLIDEVRIYNRALSASEVKSLYNQSASKFNKTPVNTLTNGLVGYWTFDGADTNFTTNTVTDKSGNGNTGTMTNMPTTTARAPGKIGQALKFDGVDDYVSVPPVFTTNQTELTTSAWVYFKSFNQPSGTYKRNNIVSGWYNWNLHSGYLFGITHNSSNNTSWSHMVNNGTEYSISYDTLSDAAFSAKYLNKWIHAVLVFKGGQYMKIYLDGELKNTTTSVPSEMVPDTSNNTWIGRSNINAGYTNSLIDEVRIYNRALSASEVKTLYNMGR